MARLALILALVLVAQAVLVLEGTGSTQAQAAYSVVASGLDAPRGMTFGPDGALYIAEGGSGGSEQSAWVPPFQTARIGTSGRILKYTGTQQAVVATGLQSIGLGPEPEIVGPQDVAFVGSTLYAVVGQMNALPTGRETFSLLVKVSPNGTTETVADLGRFEREKNPDEAPPDSNPYGLTAGPDGNLYVAEAGANAVLRVTPGGEISVAAVWKTNAVPTSVAFMGGQPYVGFLSPNPFANGSARVERIMPSGQTEVAVPGLTTVVDVETGPDGALYILELTGERILQPPPPRFKEQSGRVLRVTPGGTPTPVVTGLNFPTKLAFGPDGALYVTNNGTSSGARSGQILKVTLPAAGGAAVAIPASEAARPPAPPAGAAAAPSPAAKPQAQTPPAPAAKPQAQPSPAPAQAPRNLPRTGIGPDLAALAAPSAVAGFALTLAGLALRRRRR